MLNKVIVYSTATTTGNGPTNYLCDSCLEKRLKAVKKNGGSIFREGKIEGKTCDMCLEEK